MSAPTVVSLFSGCGGLDLGLRQAGFRILFGTDSDSFAAASHAVNFPEAGFFHGSVVDLTSEVVTGITPEVVPGQVDLLVGGPPCPPFSKSRFYRTDKPRAMDDPVGAATMNGYLRTLEWLRPSAFLMENVPGLGYAVHNDALIHIVERAGELGYACEYRILNAADYGVPQIRQRFFLVGLRDGLRFEWPAAQYTNPLSQDLFSSGLRSWRTAGDVLNELDTEENADDTGHVAGGKHHHLLEQIPPGDNYLFLTAKRGHPNPEFEWRKRYWSFLLKLSPDLPSWTIQARRSNNMGPLHWRNRILRIEEVKRLQSFPDDWELDGRVEQQWRQVGNAVPPMLAAAIGRSLVVALRAKSTDLRASA